VFVFILASCVFVAPKNLLALPPLGGKGLGRPAQLGLPCAGLGYLTAIFCSKKF